MPQNGFSQIEKGWGILLDLLGSAKFFGRQIKEDEKSLEEKKRYFLNEIAKLNEVRRLQVKSRLQKCNRAICLMHRVVFHDSKPIDWLVAEDDMFLVSVLETWTSSHRDYDGDPDYRKNSRQYCSSACRTCHGIVSRGVNDNKGHCHSLVNVPPVLHLVHLYTEEIIDLISEQVFEMPVVTIENLASL